MSDLGKLIEAVEAGTWYGDTKSMFEHAEHMNAYKAHNGSLDAAKALHDALLPGWIVGQIGQDVCDGSGGWSVWLVAPDYLSTCIQSQGSADNPARAWLLAILKAHRAQDGKGGGE